MKERPILFSTPMVQAILNGRKTQTRRVINCVCNLDHLGRKLGEWGLSIPPHQWSGDSDEVRWGWKGKKPPKKGDWVEVFQTDVDDHASAPVRCPFGEVGDRLWVREKYQIGDPDAISHRDCVFSDSPYASEVKRWVSPIHMPRWASRILLQITAVTAERLHEISEGAALDEGIQRWDQGPLMLRYGLPDWCPTARLDSARNAFAYLWESLHGVGSWNANPWVWVIEFKRVES